MAPSRYQNPPQAPPTFTATPSSLIEDTKRIIETAKKLEDSLVQDVKPSEATFAKVLLPMAYDENAQGLETPTLGFYQSVSTDKALRDASTEADQLFSNYGIESAMREDVFALVNAVSEAGEKLDPESERFLEKARKSYTKNGLGIPAGPKRNRFKEIKQRLSELSIQFSKTLNEENGGLWFSAKELEGVPADLVSSLKKGEGENEGQLFVTFKYTDLFPVLSYAKNSETRRKMFIANENKCNDNVPIFRETILLRDEAARLLGYPNHATFRIEDKMSKTPKTVDDFLLNLKERLAPGGLDEIEKLKALKKQDLKDRGDEKSFDDHYYLWDHRFYDRLVQERDYALDQEKIAEYFPLSNTIQGMFKIFEDLMGLVFVEITSEDRDKLAPSGKGSDIVWHEECKLFSVWNDESGGDEFVGYLYLDLHPRHGKYGHAANFNISPVSSTIA